MNADSKPGLPLFVYGTLLSGEAQAALLGSLRRRPASTMGKLYALPAGYPALVLGGNAVVHGELVDPPPEALLALLDAYEGVDQGLYRRIEVTARVGLLPIRAAAYAMDAARARTGRWVRSGRWRSATRR